MAKKPTLEANMEINTQQMEALLHLQEQQAQNPRKSGGQAAGFEALFNQQMQSQTAGLAGMPASPVAVQTEIYTQTLAANDQEREDLDPDSAVLQAAFEQASGTLALWDSYARALGGATSDATLRDAWGMLEGIDSQIAQMRNHPARALDSGLDGILNELEIMTATEKFKFNRGDYL